MIGIFISIVTVLERVSQLCHLFDQVLVGLEFIALIDWLKLSFLFASCSNLLPELLDRSLQLSFLAAEEVHALRDIYEVCDSFLFLLSFNLRHIDP